MPADQWKCLVSPTTRTRKHRKQHRKRSQKGQDKHNARVACVVGPPVCGDGGGGGRGSVPSAAPRRRLQEKRARQRLHGSDKEEHWNERVSTCMILSHVRGNASILHFLRVSILSFPFFFFFSFITSNCSHKCCLALQSCNVTCILCNQPIKRGNEIFPGLLPFIS